MYLPVGKVVDGVIRTLQESVLPDVHTAYARGQVYAIIDVLNNMRDRIEEKALIADGELSSLETAFETAFALLQSGQSTNVVEGFQHRFRDAREQEPERRIGVLRRLLVDMLTQLDALPDALRAQVREALAEHMAAQALRDVMLLKPSMLREISEG